MGKRAGRDNSCVQQRNECSIWAVRVHCGTAFTVGGCDVRSVQGERTERGSRRVGLCLCVWRPGRCDASHGMPACTGYVAVRWWTPRRARSRAQCGRDCGGMTMSRAHRGFSLHLNLQITARLAARHTLVSSHGSSLLTVVPRGDICCLPSFVRWSTSWHMRNRLSNLARARL